jgi:predicted nuclease of predicted toxin-antitoxin system
MRFLVDECTGPRAAEWLMAQGHEVLSAYDHSRGAPDDALLARAAAEDRILITNDRDFGELIFREGRAHRGVIFLRLVDERPANKIRVLTRLLANHQEQLAGQFVVVTESQVRIAGDSYPL